MNFKTQKEFNKALDDIMKPKRLPLRVTLRAFFENQCVSHLRKHARGQPEPSFVRTKWFKFCSKCEYKLRPTRKDKI